jgi:hypothetical protein
MIELAVTTIVVAYLAWDRHQTAKILTAQIAQADRMAQRLQAPELAVAEHVAAHVGDYAPPAVDMFSDEQHWQSKDELAALVDGVNRGDR